MKLEEVTWQVSIHTEYINYFACVLYLLKFLGVRFIVEGKKKER
jgi:hypothetical protein